MSDQAPTRGYEKSDAPPLLIGSLALGFAVFLFVSPLILQTLSPVRETTARPGQRPPEPRLQIDARSDLASFNRSEQSQFDATGWVDRDHNIVRIPIKDAMKLIVRRGLPGWPGARTSSAATAVH